MSLASIVGIILNLIIKSENDLKQQILVNESRYEQLKREIKEEVLKELKDEKKTSIKDHKIIKNVSNKINHNMKKEKKTE